MTHPSDQSAISILKRARDKGIPIVPFLGAGISAGAGFPTIDRLRDYLSLVSTYITNELYKDRLGNKLFHDPLDPAPPSVFEYLTAFGWPNISDLTGMLWQQLNELLSLPDKDAVRRAYFDFLFPATNPYGDAVTQAERDSLFQTYRRNTDGSRWGTSRWRLQTLILNALLKELSRVHPDGALAESASAHQMKTIREGDAAWDFKPSPNYWTQLLAMVEGNLDYVDLLFSGLSYSRRPSTAHTLLAHLVRLLDTRLVLTLNFDSLFEQALRDEGLAMRTFDIFRDAALPHARLVDSQLSLLKLHGSSYGLRMGERIDYALDADTKMRALSIIPHNAVLLVMGFSGEERRMRQLLEAALRQNAHHASDVPTILWMHYERIPPRAFWQLHDLNNKAVQAWPVAEIPTFVIEAWTEIAGTPPVSRIPYRASRTRLKDLCESQGSAMRSVTTPELQPWAEEDESKCFVQLFLNPVWQSTEKLPSSAVASSRGSLALSKFVAGREQGGYTSIWIDLERHHTVAGVILDIFQQIKRVDPEIEAPLVSLFSPPTFSVLNPSESSIERRQRQLQRAAARFQHALRRGKFVVAFDALESFSRPQTVHHGIPRLSDIVEHTRSDRIVKVTLTRLDDLLTFLRMSCSLTSTDDYELALHRGLGDSYIAISLDVPTSRHDYPDDTTSLRAKIADKLDAFAQEILCARDLIAKPGQLGWNNPLICVPPINSVSASDLPDFESSSIADVLTSIDSDNLLSHLVVDHKCLTTSNYRKSTLLAIMCVFRRPRSLISLRQVAGPFFAVDAGDLDPACQAEIAADKFAAMSEVLDALQKDHVIQQMDGKFYWLARPHHERLYKHLTARIGRKAIGRLVCDISMNRAPDLDPIRQAIARLIFLAGTHRKIARYYYTKSFLSSHDVDEFFEFLFHRVSRIKYLVSLEAVLRCVEAVGLRVLDSSKLVTRETSQETSSIPRWMRFLDDSLVVSSDVQSLDIPFPSDFESHKLSEIIAENRLRDIRALRETINREFPRLLTMLSPDTWMGWMEQLLEYDLELFELRSLQPRVLGTEADPILATQPSDCLINTECKDLEILLRDQQAAILREKGEYSHAVIARVAQLAEAVPQLLEGLNAPTELMAELRFSTHARSLSASDVAQEILRGGVISKAVTLCEFVLSKVRTTEAQELMAVYDSLIQLIKICDVVSDIALCLSHLESGGDKCLKAGRTVFHSLQTMVVQRIWKHIYTVRSKEGVSAHAISMIERALGQTEAAIGVGATTALANSVDAWEEVRLGLTKGIASQRDEGWTVRRIAKSLAQSAERWEEMVRTGKFPSGGDYFLIRAKLQTLRARAAYLVLLHPVAHKLLDTAQAGLQACGTPMATHSLVWTYLYRAENLVLSAANSIPVSPAPVEKRVQRLQRAQRELINAETILGGHRPTTIWHELCLLRAQIAIEYLLLMLEDGRPSARSFVTSFPAGASRIPKSQPSNSAADRHEELAIVSSPESAARMLDEARRLGLGAVIDAFDSRLRDTLDEVAFNLGFARVMRRWAGLFFGTYLAAHRHGLLSPLLPQGLVEFQQSWDRLSRSLGFEVLVSPRSSDKPDFISEFHQIIVHVPQDLAKMNSRSAGDTLRSILDGEAFANLCARAAKGTLNSSEH
jgi:hypothetical protein